MLTWGELTPDLIAQAVELDRLALGGLWNQEGYERELDSPNSDLLILTHTGVSQPGQCVSEQDGRSQTLASDTRSNSAISSASVSQVIGCGCLWEILEEAHITLLAIHPHYRRQSLGSSLLFLLLYSAWKRGLEWATLEVRASNDGAIALYQQFGFDVVGRRPKYYPNTEEDALILWRKGLQHPAFQTCLQEWHTQLSAQLSRAGWSLSLPEPVQA